MKNFILDTNIFINDPKCIRKFGKNNIIIPITVIDELDNLKNENSDRASAARTAIRLIDEVRENHDKKLHEGVKMENGGTLYVSTDLPDLDGDDITNDTLILHFAKEFDKNNKNVQLITEDGNLRIRGEAYDLDVQRYKNMRAEDDTMYDKIKKVRCVDEDINKLFSKNAVSIDNLSFDGDYVENESLKLESSSSNALARYKQDILRVIRDKDVKNTFRIQPRNSEQAFALDLLLDKDIKLVCLSGKAGVGKTLLALAAGLQQSMNENFYDKVTVARPTVAMGNELGFTPGTVEEKMEPWMAPIYDNIDFLFKKGNKKVKKSISTDLQYMDQIDVMALTYIRGRSISDEFVIIDELQNCSPHEIKTIVTRAAEGTKIVCTGDPYQIDNPYVDQYSNGLSYLIDRMEGEKIFGYVNLIEGERSELAETAARKL